MPDIVVHTKFGAEVLERIQLDLERAVYDFGLLGPDPYLFYRYFIPPFRNRVNRYSSVMHRERTGAFLLELARRATDNSSVFSYLCGFLCHYALDSATHPYINRKAGSSAVMHMAIEHKLDVMSGGNIRIPPFLPPALKNDVGGAITKIYGWSDAWEKLREGRRHMASFYRIVSDVTGRLDRIATLTHTKLSLISYRSKAIDAMDLSGFQPLYQQALDDAIRFIGAALSFVTGDSDEAKLRSVIGSRSYIDGSEYAEG